jgi:hypothetical protein
MASTLSRTIKAGKRTYFLDVKQTKDGEAFLAITQSRLTGEGGERERATILVFANVLDDFVQHLTEVAGAMRDQAQA